MENILRKRGTEGEWWRRREVDKVEGERKFRGKGIGTGEEGDLWEEGGRESLGGEINSMSLRSGKCVRTQKYFVMCYLIGS